MSKKPATKERFCSQCGASLGLVADRHWERGDTCGLLQCNRAARDDEQEQREEAHRRLDEDMGW